MSTIEDLRATLTGPGGPFEVVTEAVNGIEMTVYKDRMKALREVIAMASLRGDEQTFLAYADREYGFARFVALANSVSATLADRHGVGKGDRVAVLSANNPEWCLSFWGTVDLGAILVGLNGWWKADEIVFGLEDSGAKVLVADARRFERVADEIERIDSVEAVYLVDADPADFGGGPKLHRFDELLERADAPIPDTPIDEDDPAVIFYTSGTTGRPKGAISTHRSMIANLQNTIFFTVGSAMAAAADRPADAPDTPSAPTVSLLTSPLFHVSGCHSNLVVGLTGGVKIVIPEGKFEPTKILDLIQRHRVTTWATVPTMVWRVCEHPDRADYDTGSVTTVSFGGSPSADELQRKVLETFPNVSSTANAYGLTESSSVATIIAGKEAFARPTSVGRPMPVVEIRVDDGKGGGQPAGQIGEILIKGPIIMPGYWKRPDATKETVVDGWLHTGDIGYLDDDGFLYITDRAKDMIIRGGENVYCVEIENRLVDHPEIADAAVIGVPHPSLGEEVKAVVQVEPGSSLTEADIRAWVAEALADFKVPTYIDIVTDKLPRNASGKLLKNVLRGEGEVSFAETM